MDRNELYDKMAARKFKPKDLEPYAGDNGRVNKCAQLFRSGKLKTGGTLLDVGGGIGDLGFAVRDLFERTVVIDIAGKNITAARAKGNLTLLCDVDLEGLRVERVTKSEHFLYDRGREWDWADEMPCIDVVTALDFIEHIVDPENFARECFRVLKPGGHVFINTPNIRFFRHIRQLWHHGRFPHTSGDRDVYHGGHLAFFTFQDLWEIFENAGFKQFEMIMDEEGYVEPSPRWLVGLVPSKHLLMELGCPNLLFKCVKP